MTEDKLVDRALEKLNSPNSMPYKISSLHTYPIKSCGAIDLQEAKLSEYGFEYDRFWMLVDEKNQFITQREHAELCLFKPEFIGNTLSISYKGESIDIPFTLSNDITSVKSKVWGSPVIGHVENKEICDWFSAQLNKDVKLIRSQTEKYRTAKKHSDSKIHFPDGHQHAIIGEASMNQLNQKIGDHLNVDRFRANIIFSGGESHDEDNWKKINIGGNIFERTKSISRCPVTCIDQSTAQKGKEPLKTLATYRRGYFKKVLFGSYYKLVDKKTADISVADELLVL